MAEAAVEAKEAVSVADEPQSLPEKQAKEQAAPPAEPNEGPQQKDDDTDSPPDDPTSPPEESLSKVPTTSSFQSALSSHKSSSTTHLPAEAASASTAAPVRRLPSHLSSGSEDSRDLTTIPDPRKRAMTSPARSPEDEITALSTKLIDAINCQTTLDDTLSKTRMELEAEREKVCKLEEMADRQKEFLTGGVWVRKDTVEQERSQFAAKTREERRLRVEAEEAKKKMEQELETLTAELFEQANKMVTDVKATAQAEQAQAAKRYDNLKAQLADTEGLLKSQQEQLSELKQVMEAMILSESRDDQTTQTTLTTPTSPGFERFGESDSSDSETETTGAEMKAIEAFSTAPPQTAVVDGSTESSPTSESAPATTATTATTSATTTTTAATTAAGASAAASTTGATAATAAAASPSITPSATFEQQLSPANPMSFAHLLRPVLRHDITAYNEFIDLVRASQLQAMLLQQNAQPHVRSPSSTSLPKTPPIGTNTWAATVGSTAPPTIPAATVVNGLSPSHQQVINAKELKDSKFYKRVLAEDIESTLRLDQAPGISWLVRRSIMAAMVEGTLVAEPVPAGSGHFATDSSGVAFHNSCALCGENRRQEPYLRRHRFRLTESDKSTPYPLCGYCLGRVRAVCDFLVFLRMIKDGHWRADDEEAEHAAWEEGVRLREQMFWARIGGGVLPLVGNTVASGIASGRHSRITSGAHHALTPNHTGTAANGASSSTNPPASSPLASPSTGPGLGIVSSNTSNNTSNSTNNGTSSGRATPTHIKNPSRSSAISSSMAAIVSGLGGHVA